MNYKQLGTQGGMRRFVVVLDAGEEAFESLTGFARHERLSAGSMTAIGAFQKATVGWFDLPAKTYREIPIDEQSEVLSLIGDIARDENGRPSLHLHAVLGLSDGSTKGGHFIRGTVRPTLEVMITEAPTELSRRHRADLGIALIDLL
ncbi:PPC domain-containing DNA-binding protein [Bosea sp. (in: a-proteobacteria)]|uniref:PPC domain-containing DNA-binding protein n=1 Tax=Bosea sp. (in: a-proteobacteria) TaxID=1871050 RepID=UPI003B3BE739